jgi:hypothetical protein
VSDTDTGAAVRRAPARSRRVGAALIVLVALAAIVTTFTGLPPYRYAKSDLDELRDRLNAANSSCPAFPGHASVDLIRSRVMIPVRPGQISTNVPSSARLSPSDQDMIGGSHMFLEVVCTS